MRPLSAFSPLSGIQQKPLGQVYFGNTDLDEDFVAKKFMVLKDVLDDKSLQDLRNWTAKQPYYELREEKALKQIFAENTQINIDKNGQVTFWKYSHAPEEIRPILGKLINLFDKTVQEKFQAHLPTVDRPLDILIHTYDVPPGQTIQAPNEWHYDFKTYTMVFCMDDPDSPIDGWEGGEFILAKMGSKYGAHIRPRPTEKVPAYLLEPRLNQAIVFSNQDTLHMVNVLKALSTNTQNTKRRIIIMEMGPRMPDL